MRRSGSGSARRCRAKPHGSKPWFSNGGATPRRSRRSGGLRSPGSPNLWAGPSPEEIELPLPDLAAAVSRTRAARTELRQRPEFDQFGRTRERIEQQRVAASAQERPRVSAFGRLGYGKPGLNFIADQWDTYWSAGIQLQWTPWTWGTADRERAALVLQQKIVDADEAAFRDGLDRAVQDDLAELDRLEATRALDDQIVALRESIDRETRLRYDERAVPAAEYLDQSTDLLDARLATVTHRVELARASARLLTTLGVEVR